MTPNENSESDLDALDQLWDAVSEGADISPPLDPANRERVAIMRALLRYDPANTIAMHSEPVPSASGRHPAASILPSLPIPRAHELNRHPNWRWLNAIAAAIVLLSIGGTMMLGPGRSLFDEEQLHQIAAISSPDASNNGTIMSIQFTPDSIPGESLDVGVWEVTLSAHRGITIPSAVDVYVVSGAAELVSSRGIETIPAGEHSQAPVNPVGLRNVSNVDATIWILTPMWMDANAATTWHIADISYLTPSAENRNATPSVMPSVDGNLKLETTVAAPNGYVVTVTVALFHAEVGEDIGPFIDRDTTAIRVLKGELDVTSGSNPIPEITRAGQTYELNPADSPSQTFKAGKNSPLEFLTITVNARPDNASLPEEFRPE